MHCFIQVQDDGRSPIFVQADLNHEELRRSPEMLALRGFDDSVCAAISALFLELPYASALWLGTHPVVVRLGAL